MLRFVNEKGDFQVKHPNEVSYTYFPLCNDFGMKNSITHSLNGDMKANQHQFMLAPVSQEDLQNSSFGRNFWIKYKDKNPISVVGNSAIQKTKEDLNMTLDAGLLWHQVSLDEDNLESKVMTYVPNVKGYIELSKVTLKNKGNLPLTFRPSVVVPLYSRSADNLRDHRHVTALLNHMEIVENGIVNKPTLSFDEHGHHKNNMFYGVFSKDDKGNNPSEFYPILEEFVGEGGSLLWPKTIVKGLKSGYKVGDSVKGYEGIGAMSFDEITLEAGAEKEYIFALGMSEDLEALQEMISTYLTIDGFNEGLEANKAHWEKALYNLEFETQDPAFGLWLKWVTLQPILRRIYGCSFLPHHDYGRGGRGWRDLWQDCLALIVMEPDPVREMLFNNFGGVRIDGTNATIIGEKPGEFLADRNNIPRVWMDHGVWPLVTTKLYIDRTGDVEFLFQDQNYFKDQHTAFGKGKDATYKESDGPWLLSQKGGLYKGSILEHLLLQNLVSFYNVGDHKMIRLEGADWNDGLDMAKDKGESVAFSAAYVGNLTILRDIFAHISSLNIETVSIAKEMTVLFDTIEGPIDYESIKDKHDLLKSYFASIEGKLSGEKVDLKVSDILLDLEKKEVSLKKQILESQWIDLNENEGFFNGYYDNDGNPLEGAGEKVNMTLTGQVFTTMYGIGQAKHIEKTVNAAKHYLYDKVVGGYRLNTDFEEVKLNMGRLFGFAYGHKENGAMFSHMATMYSNALYKQGFVKEGFEVIHDLYSHCMDFEKSKIYPGVPEYIDPKGRGMYHYLTGSASWLILTVLDEAYGVKGRYGDLFLEPKLTPELINSNNSAIVKTLFGNHRVTVEYHCLSELTKDLTIKEVLLNDEVIGESIQEVKRTKQTVQISRAYLSKYIEAKHLEGLETTIKVVLG